MKVPDSILQPLAHTNLIRLKVNRMLVTVNQTGFDQYGDCFCFVARNATLPFVVDDADCSVQSEISATRCFLANETTTRAPLEMPPNGFYYGLSFMTYLLLWSLLCVLMVVCGVVVARFFRQRLQRDQALWQQQQPPSSVVVFKQLQLTPRGAEKRVMS